jgi:hypothetical protein
MIDKTENQNSPKPRPPKKTIACRCDDCVYYDYDEELESYVCQMSLDEDEMGSFIAGRTKECPYFRFYDEYKTVQKQN